MRHEPSRYNFGIPLLPVKKRAMTRKKLPVGIQTFREIREDDCYYVDKTAFALRMIREGKAYFLSRPCRFGKSLFLDTLAELFAGNEALFQGLYCHDKWDWSIQYPVIRLSFGAGISSGRAEELAVRIRELLKQNARRLGLTLEDASIPGQFSQLILEAEAKFGQRVVVRDRQIDLALGRRAHAPETGKLHRTAFRLRGRRDFHRSPDVPVRLFDHCP
jgi:hypothetical protein